FLARAAVRHRNVAARNLRAALSAKPFSTIPRRIAAGGGLGKNKFTREKVARKSQEKGKTRDDAIQRQDRRRRSAVSHRIVLDQRKIHRRHRNSQVRHGQRAGSRVGSRQQSRGWRQRRSASFSRRV